MKLKFNFLLLSLIFFSCFKKEKKSEINDYNENKIIESKTPEQFENKAIETKYCFVRKLIEKDGKNYLIADYVQFLTGEEALKKAIQNKDTDFELNEKGDTIHSVPNDYYVSNVNPKLRTLELVSNVSIELWNEGVHNKVTINEFKKHLSEEPLIILKIQNGMVKEMSEQYVP